MPFLESLALTAAPSILGSVFGGMSQRKQRDYSYKQAVEFWNMQNEYNSPANQMRLLKEAGINPHYAFGGSGSPSTASPVPTADTSFHKPTVGNMDILGGYVDFEHKMAQIDTLEAQRALWLQEGALKAAQASNIGVGTQKNQFELDLMTELRQTSVDAAKEGLRKMKADTDFTLAENERKAVQNIVSIREAGARILRMRMQNSKDQAERQRIKQQIKNLKEDEKIKRLDREARQMGVNPNHPLWAQMIARIINDQSDSNSSNFGSGFFKGLQSWFK